ncbi:putative Nicotinamide-nucleotide amidohydrolase PncC [Blattamonas nauphoetae]|uniref:Nicotinamide-nucleotide amidohydrolase PncC n=1 Tax=Blattamonas nauphoetae TaxID=2049346 RepID=A0ABQ9YLY0_9EUKA|nr:putative Nicotinamide-nucleotide amidohydrolase PncC [Blattamonas nauphoetae]
MESPTHPAEQSHIIWIKKNTTNRTLAPQIEQLIRTHVDTAKKMSGQELVNASKTAMLSVSQPLLQKSIKLSVSESCTGGMLSAHIVSISGISEIYEGGVVSYSNHVKEKVLGVSSESIDGPGAVSHETAVEMATGVSTLMETHCGLSTTGVAGPLGGTPTKPVGLVYAGFSFPQLSFSARYELWPDDGAYERQDIREMTCFVSLSLLRSLIEEVHVI